MDIRNIALVRATNIIPFDGVVRPTSEVPYLKKENGSQFSFAMFDLLKRQGKLKEIDWTKPEEIGATNKENTKILNEYMPYNSGYNSMVLWALNGLVPDDMNNTFSDKSCAIIDGLAEQIETSKIISLVPTDTAIKGNVRLSNQAIILISKERYETLSEDEKEMLAKLDLDISIFEGDLKDAINQKLEENDRYTPETLSLTREHKGYIKSDTSEELIETINDVANEKNIAQELHWNVVMGQSDHLNKLERVKDEYENTGIVQDFYKQTFFKHLFSKMDIDNDVKTGAILIPESSVYMCALCEEIEKIGLNEYKNIVNTYNEAIEQLKKEGKLPTPQEIVDLQKENKTIDLNSLIEETIKEKEGRNNSVTIENLVRNACSEQNIEIEDIRKVDLVEEGEQIPENTNEGVNLDD